jgi:uncharacterized protein
MRAQSKVRGKMLEIFLTKTKAKIRMELAEAASTAVVSDEESQIMDLQADLEAKTMALAELEGKLAALDQSTDIEELKTQKLAQILALEKKIEELETLNKNMLESERTAREKEASLLQEIELVTKAITTAKSSSELDKIKEEVATIASTRVETSKEELTKQIEVLSANLKENAKKMSEDDAKELKASIEKLSSSAQNVSTTEDIISLRAEADGIGSSLKERGAIAQTKAELALLKKAVEEEIKVEGKTKEENAALQKALASLDGVDKMSNEELVLLKSQIVESRKAVQHQELTQKTQDDVLELSQKLEVLLKASEGDSTEELEASLEAIKKIQAELAKSKTTEELLAVKTEIDALKEVIKDKVDIPVDEASRSTKSDERSFRSAQTGSTRKRKAKNRIMNFLSKIMRNKKMMQEEAPTGKDEEDLILPPCLSGIQSVPVSVPGKAPSASFERPAEHTDAETDEEHPVKSETDQEDPLKTETDVKEESQLPTSPSLTSEKSKKSMRSKKSTKSTRSFKSVKSTKSNASSKASKVSKASSKASKVSKASSKASSKTSVSSKVDAETGEVQIAEQPPTVTTVST